jgi:transcriptional regulator with XRE-family HTH domain
MGETHGRSPAAADVEIGQRVRTRRLELGISQVELGRSIGVTFQQVQKYERGANRIGGSRLQQIADALLVGPAYFFGATPAASMTDVPKEGFLGAALADRAAVELLRAFSLIGDDRRREALVDLVRALAKAPEASVPSHRRRHRKVRAAHRERAG